MKLDEVLNEASEDLVKKYAPILANYKRRDVAEDALRAVEEGLKNKLIYNVDFGDAKSTFGYAYEKVAEPLGRAILHEIQEKLGKDETRDEYYKFISDNDFNFSFFYLHEAKKTVRQYENLIKKLKEKGYDTAVKNAETALELHRLALDFWEKLKSLKPHVVKGRKPKPVDPNAFTSKLGSKEAQEVVRKAIKKNIDPKLDEFEKLIEDWYQDYVDYWRDHVKAKDTLVFHENDRPDQMYMGVLNKLWDAKVDRNYATGETTYTNLKERPEAAGWAKKQAKEYRDAIENRFVSKNLKKLTSIVDNKGNLSDIDELPSKEVKVVSGSATIEAGLKFKFADGSFFDVVNKIVSKRSSGGRWGDGKDYEQYPTTFHNVTFPNGDKMKMPSEEKMVKEFK